MALIRCSECGKEISDRASVCMNCGSPIEKCLTSDVNSNNTVANYEINIKTDENVMNVNRCNGFSIAGFAMSIVSFLFDIYGLVSFAALMFSIVGHVNSTNQKSKTFALIGIILSAIELFFKFLQLINYLSLLNQI